MDANGLEQNVVLSQLKQCRSHMLTQRKRIQKNRLICIQLRLLRTRFEIKDTGIENDFDLFFFLWGVWRGEMKNCAYLRKNPGYAPVYADFITGMIIVYLTDINLVVATVVSVF